MSTALPLLRTRIRALCNVPKTAGRHSRFKAVTVGTMGAGILAATYYLPYRAFLFLQSMGDSGNVLIDRMLYLFFMALFCMLIFSNAIISYATHFQGRETSFLFTLPIRHEELYLIKFIDTVVMSSWMFLCFLYPVLTAYAVVRKLSWYFYPALLIFFIPFAFIAGAIGCLCMMSIMRTAPRRLFRRLPYVTAVIFFTGIVWFWQQGRGLETASNEVTFLLTNVIPQFGLSQWIAAPNYWLSEGLFRLIAGRPGDALFWWLLLTSNALFFSLVAIKISRRIYYTAWLRVPLFSESQGAISSGGRMERMLKNLPLIPQPLLSLAVKDIKTFLRDPLQWSQFTIFFGLLAIYFANIRTLGYSALVPFWKNIVAFLNVASTNLTLASLSVRFVFPQLSLEGRRFWILGLAPVSPFEILLEKFFLNSAISLCICIPLIILSNTMLGVSGLFMNLSLAGVSIMCVSMTAICIGLGALFPNLQEENPAKIVSGFGGTLALVFCLLYITVSILLLALPVHFHITGTLPAEKFHHTIVTTGAFFLLLNAAIISGALLSGARALKNLEF